MTMASYGEAPRHSAPELSGRDGGRAELKFRATTSPIAAPDPADPGPRIPDPDKASSMAIQFDEQLRRYEDLARRAGDLRSYL